MRDCNKCIADEIANPLLISSPLGLLPVNSIGMRRIIDEYCALQAELARTEKHLTLCEKQLYASAEQCDDNAILVMNLYNEFVRPTVPSFLDENPYAEPCDEHVTTFRGKPIHYNDVRRVSEEVRENIRQLAL